MVVRGAGTAAVGTLLLVVGCTSGQVPEEHVSEEFAFRAPDPPCPPPSELETPPIADERSDTLLDPTLTVVAPSLLEDDDHFLMICTYDRGGTASTERTYPEEHVRLSARIMLYPEWEDSPNSQVGTYDELPTSSDDLSDWAEVAGISGDPDVLRANCGSGIPCQEGEKPTIQSYQLHWEFAGHVGNLDFSNVTVDYRVERLSVELEADLEPTVIAIFRDFVLAILESYQPVD